MGAALDLTGYRFGKLLVQNFSWRNEKNGMGYWNCLCDCGNASVATLGNLRYGHTTSCGCNQAENRTKHGLYKSPIYSSWQKMRARCNPNNLEYELEYWGRGISVCKEWDHFVVFHTDMISSFIDGAILDRIDPNGNYCKSNCRWVYTTMSSFNTRLHINNSSGCSGVRWRKDKNAWESKIAKNNSKTFLGYFNKKEDAFKVRLDAELELYGEYKEKDVDKLKVLLEFAGINNTNLNN